MNSATLIKQSTVRCDHCRSQGPGFTVMADNHPACSWCATCWAWLVGAAESLKPYQSGSVTHEARP